MKLYQRKKFETQVHDLIEECDVSRQQRISTGAFWKQAWLTGQTGGQSNDPAQYNKIWESIDELKSQLYSPSEVRASITYDFTQPPDVLAMAQAASTYLTREVSDGGVDIDFANALDWGLVKGWAGLKLGWEKGGLQGYIIQPENFGVQNESVAGLEEQQCFMHTMFLSRAQVEQRLFEHPEKKDILRKVLNASQRTKDDEQKQESWFHQIVIGGTQPVATAGPTNPSGGIVSVVGPPIPIINASVVQSLVRLDELWVIDDERQDYTTIQVLHPDIIIEGVNQRRNLYLKGEHPFHEIVPLPIDGYFWGQSSIFPMVGLQDMVNKRITDFNTIWRRQAKPSMKATGVTGMTDEKIRKLNSPGGWVSDESPAAKIEEFIPQLPQGAFEELQAILGFFDNISGTKPIMQGRGEPGVRSGVHGRTLLRSASGRVRDRALLVERDMESVLDGCLKLLQAKVPQEIAIDQIRFFLAQLPSGFSVKVDSHSASPAFSEDAKDLAFQLRGIEAIDNEDVLMLTNPPHMDILIAKAKARAAAEAKFREEHPDAADGAKRKR